MDKKIILLIIIIFCLSGMVISTVEHPGHCGATNPADVVFYCGSDAGIAECEYD